MGAKVVSTLVLLAFPVRIPSKWKMEIALLCAIKDMYSAVKEGSMKLSGMLEEDLILNVVVDEPDGLTDEQCDEMQSELSALLNPPKNAS